MSQKYRALLTVLLIVAALFPSVVLAQSASPSLVQTAYDRIEDQINSKTSLVVRIDLTEIDLAACAASIETVCANHFKERGFKTENAKATRHEIHVGLDNLVQTLEPLVAMRKALGVREVFIIRQSMSDKSQRIVVPGATGDLQKLLNLFFKNSGTFKQIKTAKGTAFVADPKADAEIYKNFKKSPNQLLKQFFQSGASGSIQFFCKELDLESLSRSFEDLGAAEETAREFAAFKSYFQQLEISIDVNKLAIKGALVFTTAERADKGRKELEALADAFVDAAYSSSADSSVLPESVVDDYDLQGLLREMHRASLKAALPKRSGSSLNFELSPGADAFWSNIVALAIL